MDLWELTNTVVNYKIDKYLLDLGFKYESKCTKLTKIKNININNITFDIIINVEINNSNNRSENLLSIKAPYYTDKIEFLKYFNRGITIEEFEEIADNLIGEFITKISK